jgi:hypothetical protein
VILGGLLGGVIGDLFGGESAPRTQIGYYPEGTHPYQPEAGDMFTIRHAELLGGAADDIKMVFEAVRDNLADFVQAIGGDLDKFSEVWLSTRDNIEEGMDLDRVVELWLQDYSEFLTGIDFTQFQKAGEEFLETIERITMAVAQYDDVLKSFDYTIQAIMGDWSEFDEYTVTLGQINDQIEQLEEALDKATDPADALQYADALKLAAYERYNYEIQLVQSLKDAIEQLGQEIMSTEMAFANFMIGIQQQLDQFTGSLGGTAQLIAQYAPLLLSRIAGATDPSQQLQLIGFGQQALTTYYDSMAAAIQGKYSDLEAEIVAKYESQIAAEERSRQAELESLDMQLQVVEGWEALLENIRDTILDLQLSAASPENVFQRMARAQEEIAALEGQYAIAEGAEKLELAAELQDLLLEYLGLAEEAYQRPSNAYALIYDMVIRNLEGIADDAEAFADQEQELQAAIADASVATSAATEAMNKELEDLNTLMDEELEELNKQMAGLLYYLQEKGIEAFLDLLEQQREEQARLESELSKIIGDKSYEAFIAEKQKEATEYLKTIKEKLIAIFDAMFPAMSAAPAAESPEVAAAAAPQGMSAPEVRVTETPININVTLMPGGNIKTKELARAIEDVTVESARHGRLKKEIRSIKVYNK